MVGRITLVGFGLLASSIASALKQSKLSVRVRAVSSRGTLKRAQELKLADEFFEYGDAEAWVADSDLILLCTPILGILSTLETLSAITPKHPVLVSDIGSTKSAICKAGAKLKVPFTFVGAHPMAGSEKRTLEFNDPSLFENAYWFLCPTDAGDTASYAALTELISFLHAEPVLLKPEEHDGTMAWLSHMPQMVSSTLAGNLPPRLLEHNFQHFAGRGFRDMTRIAASHWGMWHDILLTNREQIALALAEFAKGIEETQNAIAALPDDTLAHAVFTRGNEGRASLFAPGRNAGSLFHEITVQLKDKPGAILSVMQPLADAHLNIRDIELMKVRENLAGTLLLAFKTEEEASAAVKLLRYLEFEVEER